MDQVSHEETLIIFLTPFVELNSLLIDYFRSMEL